MGKMMFIDSTRKKMDDINFVCRSCGYACLWDDIPVRIVYDPRGTPYEVQDCPSCGISY